jgi:hypothetical protein
MRIAARTGFSIPGISKIGLNPNFCKDCDVRALAEGPSSY